MLESWTTLAALARETTTVRLGTLVTGVTYRNPAILAKTATTLDVISGGRAIFGLGAAWNEQEHVGYGFEFPPVRERMDRLDEALTIVRAMFTEDRPSFTGTPLPDRPGAQRAAADPAGRPADHGRRRRRAADPEDRGEARRHDPLVPPRARDASSQDRGPRGLLRGDRSRPVDDRADDGQRRSSSPAARAEASALVERLPPERRPYVLAGTPEQMADELRPYLDAGFTGFTFNNSTYRTTDQIGAIGELLRLIRS